MTTIQLPEYHEWIGVHPMWRAHLIGEHEQPREDCADCMVRIYMPAIHAAWRADTRPEVWNTLWDLSDGYGEPGYVPDQGYDWSGIRDSSPAAIYRMAQYLGLV